MRDPKVVILGGGPSAVYAYYAAIMSGYLRDQVEIWTKDKAVTYPPGAFWLHQLPPNCVIESPERMEVRLLGTAEGYSRKQWEETYPTSAGNYAEPKVLAAYNPHKVLPKLWAKCNVKHDGNKYSAGDVLRIAESVPYVIQTFPTDYETLDLMQCYSYPTYLGPVANLHNMCVYQGRAGIPWVRMTCAFGWVNLEYPATWLKDVGRIKAVEDINWSSDGKVVVTPDFHPTVEPIANPVIGPKENVLLTGRWATRRRGMLTHETYTDVLHFLGGL